MTEFKLPELGENIDQGDLVRLMISPGATITEGQPVMELETDKAVVEVPSSVSGTVKEIRVKEGEKIKVGQVIFTVENGAGASAARAPSPAKRKNPRRIPRKKQKRSRRLRQPRRQKQVQPNHRHQPFTESDALARLPRASPPNSNCPNSARTSRKAIWSA